MLDAMEHSKTYFTGTLSDVYVIRANHQDVNALIEIGCQTFWQAFGEMNPHEDVQAYLANWFNPQQLTSELAEEGNRFYLVKTGETVIAYLKLQMTYATEGLDLPTVILDNSCMHLQRIYVESAWHGTGLAQALMQFSMEQASAEGKTHVFLGAWEENHKAQRFYEKCGFAIVGSHTFQMGSQSHHDYWRIKSI